MDEIEKGVYVGAEEVLYEESAETAVLQDGAPPVCIGDRSGKLFGIPTLPKPGATPRGLASSMITANTVTSERKAQNQPIKFKVWCFEKG